MARARARARARSRSPSRFVVAGVVALFACGETLTLEPNDCGTACAATESCVDTKCVPGLPPDKDDPNLYVDASKANETGCSRAAPCKSIGVALKDAARRSLSNGQEVRVCKGTYRESGLVLDRAMSIRGAFDCTTWVRDQSALSPTFTTANETRIENSDVSPESTAATLEIRTINVGRSSIIDGLRIVGRVDAAAGGAALRIEGAAPTITDNVIDAASSGPSSNKMSTGITVLYGSPEIKTTRISANLANNNNFVGIFLDQVIAKVHDNIIDGGNSSHQVLGLWVNGGQPTGENAIRANQIRWTHATTSGTGIFVTSAREVDVLNNTIEQGTLKCLSAVPECRSAGIHVTDVNIGKVIGNRVLGASSTEGADKGMVGIRVSRSKTIDIASNMIHTGNLDARPETLSKPSGVVVAAEPVGSVVRVVHNTIVLHDPGDTSAYGVDLEPDAFDVTIDANLFVGTGGGRSSGVYEEVGATIKSIRANAFIITGATFRSSSGTRAHGSVGALHSDLDTNASDNVQLSVPGDCPTLDGCPAIVLNPWSPPFGAPDVIPSGYRLKLNRCALTKGAKTQLDPTTALDHFGMPRTEPASIGAAQNNDACQ